MQSIVYHIGMYMLMTIENAMLVGVFVYINQFVYLANNIYQLRYVEFLNPVS
jgi:hypothetical protein